MSDLMYDTQENRIKALLLAEADHSRLGSQEQSATRTAVWVEDGVVHYSGQWSGYSQPPEGELDQEVIIASCSLTGYNPSSGGNFGWDVSTGKDAIIDFYRLSNQDNMVQMCNRLEEDYRDADTGIRVCNGYLLQ